jgi:hypothetical protein
MNRLEIGETDAVRGLLYLHGNTTGQTTGGTMVMYVADDHNGTITNYNLKIDNDDFMIGPQNDEDAIKYDGGATEWILTPAGGTKIGGATDYVHIEADGDVNFVANGGLQFAEIYTYDNGGTVTITTSGIANKVQVTLFDANGESNGNVTPDHTNDHITIGAAGRYLVTVSIAASSTGASAYEMGWGIWVNNGATEKQNIHAHREFSGSGGDTGSISLSGIVDFAASDTVELWTWNETNTNNIIIDDLTLSVVQIGGTT